MKLDVIQENLTLEHGEPRKFSLFNSGLCRTVCQEVLDGHSYPLLPPSVLQPDSVKVIYDIGANIGASCIYWLDSYPSAHVYAFEPCAESFALLLKNVDGMNCTVRNVGLGHSDGFVSLYHSIEDPCCNSLLKHRSEGKEMVVVERSRTRLVGDIDILKIDTEGSEYAILSDVSDRLVHFKVIYLEYHSESHRHDLDLMLRGTHTLWSSSATRPHRGTLCYIHSWLIPNNYNDWAIQ